MNERKSLLARLARGRIVSIVVVAPLALSAGLVCSQQYPVKPVRVVTVGVGTTVDFLARQMGQGLTSAMGQPVIVDNRAGSAIISAQIVASAPPDGYTLLLGAGAVWLVTLLQKNVPYDPVTDLAPISLTNRGTNVLVVNASLPVKSVKELIALAKAKPGQLNFSTGATGGSTHLSGELFKAMTGVDIVRVVYTSGATEVADLLTGQVQLTFGSGALMPHVKSGKLRALAVTSAEPSPLFAELPPISATVPGYECVGYFGAFAPAKTPREIVARLNRELVAELNRPETRQRFLNADLEAVGSTPDEFAAIIRSDLAKWQKVFRSAGIQPQ